MVQISVYELVAGSPACIADRMTATLK